MKKLLFFALFLLSCSTEVPTELVADTDHPSAAGLEGTWNANGTVENEANNGLSWFMDYRFEGDEYWKSGYPPISEHGTYELSGDNILFTTSDGVASVEPFELAGDGKTLDIGELTFSYVKENP